MPKLIYEEIPEYSREEALAAADDITHSLGWKIAGFE